MKEIKHRYEICNVFDSEIFEKQSRALCDHIPGITAKNDITDVDGSIVREFRFEGLGNRKWLDLYNHKDFGVYIKSNFDIAAFF